MKVLITGGTGYIGQALCRELSKRGQELWVYSRRPQKVKQLCGESVQPLSDLNEVSALSFDAVVNLAGESIAGGRWSDARKRKLLGSRVGLTNQLCEQLAKCEQPPGIFVSGSATGYYGDGGDIELTETTDPVTQDFAHELCRQWEAAADVASSWGARVVKLRIGLVMGPGGGFLAPLKIPFSLGLASRLGDGKQWMSWISLHDMVQLIIHALDNNECDGVYNAVGGDPVTNAEFTRQFATALNRPAFFVAPAFVLKTALGELSELLLGGQRALPSRLRSEGFEFAHPDLESALKAAVA